jgi:DNA-binding response OmpR family regulator
MNNAIAAATLTRSILLAEDEVFVRMPLAKHLRDCGFRVIEVTSAHEAIEVLDDGRFPVNLVLTNVELAGDGFGIAKWVRDHRPELELVFTGTPERAVHAAAGLCKDNSSTAPMDPQLLLRRMKRLLASRKPNLDQGAKRAI